MSKPEVSIEYFNYDPIKHSNFLQLQSVKLAERNGILNLFLYFNYTIQSINDGIGFDKKGKYIFLSFGEWRNIETGLYISDDEYYLLNNNDINQYEYVSINVNIYTDRKYEIHYTENISNRIKISFIPFDLLDFK